MAIPDYQSLMLPVLKHAAHKDIRVPEIENQIADDFGLTSEERDQMLPSGRQKVLHNRMHWAKFYLSKAGLITSASHRRFIATDIGRELLARNLPRIDNQVLLEYPSFREFYEAGSAEPSDKSSAAETKGSAPALASATTPEEQIEAAHFAVHSALRADLLQRILENSPSFFEQVIVE